MHPHLRTSEQSQEGLSATILRTPFLGCDFGCVFGHTCGNIRGHMDTSKDTKHDVYGIVAKVTPEALTIARPEGMGNEEWVRMADALVQALKVGGELMAHAATLQQAIQREQAVQAKKKGLLH